MIVLGQKIHIKNKNSDLENRSLWREEYLKHESMSSVNLEELPLPKGGYMSFIKVRNAEEDRNLLGLVPKTETGESEAVQK